MSRIQSLHRWSLIALVSLAALMTSGCSRAAGPESQAEVRSTGSDAPPAVVHSQGQAGPATVAPDELVVLRQATMPTDDPQPFRIRLVDSRTTAGEGFPETVHELNLELTGTLTAHSEGKRGTGAVLRFEHIVLSYTDSGCEPATMRYDSAATGAGRSGPLHEMMAVVADAEMQLALQPGGTLVELNGLDVLWRKAGKLLVQPNLQAVQWLFRDIGMGELVRESLFPPMPEDSVGVGEHWKASLPANLLFAAALQARLDATLVSLDRSTPDQPLTRLRLVGDLVPDTQVEGARQPGLVPEVVSGHQEIDLVVHPAGRSLEQTSARHLDLRLTLQPPQGEPRRLRIEQTRRLQVERGKHFSASR